MASSSSAKIQAATLADVPSIVDILFECFSSAKQEKLFPSTPEGRKWMESCYELFVKSEPGRQQSRVLVAKNEADEAIGFALYWILGDEGYQPMISRYADLAPCINPEALSAWAVLMYDNNTKYMGKKAHIVLETLAVRKSCRGQGLGGRLVQEVTKVADDLQCETYLDAAVKAKPIYQRCGFEEKPQGNCPSIPMIRRVGQRSSI